MNPVLREVTLTLPMAPDMEVAASKTATALAEFMRMSPDKIDEVRLAVVEACINAFEHSHARDHKVYITFAVIGDREPEKLEIRVARPGRRVLGPGTSRSRASRRSSRRRASAAGA